MFKLNEIYEVHGIILKCGYIRYSPAETTTRNIPNSQICINIPREDSVFSSLNSYQVLKFETIIKADKSRCANGNDLQFINLTSIVLFSIFELTTSNGNYLEENSHAHLVSLLYKLVTSAKNTDDLSIGFDRIRDRRKQKLANIKKIKGKYRLTILLKIFFGFCRTP